MNDSLLYQAYGVKYYSYASTEYKGNAIYLHLKTNSPKRCICPHCGGHHVIKYGIVKRTLHNLPFGSKPCYLSLQIQRYCCKDCGSAWQSEIPFTHGEVSYTYRFSRYVLDLLRMGNTIKDVSRHLRVGWNMVKDIHKKYLKSRYSRPDIRKVRRIGIDEFATNKGHVYKTIVVDLDTGRIIHVGEDKGKDALDLDQIWMQKSKEEGEKQLCYWCERARETKLKPFIKVANTLMAKRTGILAWYEAHVTNAILEGINNKIKVMKRKAYGFRDDEYFKLLLLGLKDSTNAIRG